MGYYFLTKIFSMILHPANKSKIVPFYSIQNEEIIISAKLHNTKCNQSTEFQANMNQQTESPRQLLIIKKIKQFL